MTNKMICITEEEYDLFCKVVFRSHDILDALSVTQDGLNRKGEELLEDTKVAIHKIDNINSRIKG